MSKLGKRLATRAWANWMFAFYTISQQTNHESSRLLPLPYDSSLCSTLITASFLHGSIQHKTVAVCPNALQVLGFYHSCQKLDVCERFKDLKLPNPSADAIVDMFWVSIHALLSEAPVVAICVVQACFFVVAEPVENVVLKINSLIPHDDYVLLQMSRAALNVCVI